MRFRTRLLLILLPAFCGLLILGAQQALESHQTVRSLSTLRLRGAEARRAGDLAHRLQIERGLSSGVIGSKGAAFRAELDDARRQTDAALAGLAVPALAALRADVDALRIAPLASFQRHTSEIEALLAQQSALATEAHDPDVARLANALDLLSQAKEYAGRERGTLNGAFVVGKFEPEPFVRAVSVVAAQELSLARFELFASDALRRQLAVEQGGQAMQQALALRKQAFAAGSGGALTTPAAEWFKASTERIERLRVLELATGAALEAEVSAHLGAAERTRASSVVLVSLIVLCALGLGLFQAKQVLRQLGGEPAHAVAVMRRIAAGDLSEPVAVRPGDDSSILAEAAVMQQRIAALIAHIRATAGAVALSSGEIASATSDLAQRTTKEAASIEATAATMQQLTAAVKQNAASAREALEFAAKSAAAATDGGQVVQQLRATVQGVDQVVARVRDIVGTIDEVAFQTNLLALNAAVEASRAGPEGRGFAVVAAEVRTLSQRTNELAKEIGALMSDSTRRIKSGVSQAEAAEHTLEGAVTGARRVDALLKDVARASAEQSEGLAALSQTLTSIEDGTQRNAAVVEESTAAAAALRDEARVLERTVESFRLAAARPQQTTPAVPRAVTQQLAEEWEPIPQAPAPARRPLGP